MDRLLWACLALLMVCYVQSFTIRDYLRQRGKKNVPLVFNRVSSLFFLWHSKGSYKRWFQNQANSIELNDVFKSDVVIEGDLKTSTFNVK